MYALKSSMGRKNISITYEAYRALNMERRKGESFTEAILRLTRKSGRLMDCFGTWEKSDKEKGAIFDKELPAGWSRSNKSLKAIESEMP
jgi:predicted CopG family antitoxin